MEKTKEAYIDSNVFIYAAIQEKGIGEASIRILKDIISGKLNAFTSVLTFDEVFWKIKRLASAADALERTHDLLIFPNLTFLDVKLETIATAHKIIKQFGLDPRDSIHAACCLLEGVSIIISEDPDFDKLDFLKRKP